MRDPAPRAPAGIFAADGAPQIEARGMPWPKRAFDIVGAAAGLTVLLPVVVLLIVVIVLDSRGNPFYGGTRVGRGGRQFRMWKFRSMYRDADRRQAQLMAQNEAKGHIFKIKDDPRVTRVGRVLRKTSLDEIPQLWNVLRGQMSLVGPRPPLPSEVEHYEEPHLRRLEGTPGITGLWQVTARHRHSFEEMVALDIAYLEQQSFWLDVKILLRTVPAVLSARGSY